MLKSKISLRAPLPPLGKYTISEDFGLIMIEQIFTSRPRLIVEVGSGASTLLAAYCLEQMGQGTLRSLEHLPEYTNDTDRMLREHKLESLDVKVIFAPLKIYKIAGNDFSWYSTEDLKISNKIDMLIVDGPPRPTGKHARYPALPLFYSQLSSSAKILLDDANRDDEKEIINRWLLEYPNLKYQKLNTEKGAALFSLS